MSAENISIINEEQKTQFIDLLIRTERKGIDKLIEYLEQKTDFFTAPASVKFHNNFNGGLLDHSLKVYENFKGLLALKNVEMDEESVIISSLLHDLCKCNLYIKEERNKKVNNQWEKYETWGYSKDISILLPHSSRSIRVIRSFITIKYIEELCIFYHMGPFGGEDYEYRNMMQMANEKQPQTLLFYTADLISSYMDEKII